MRDIPRDTIIEDFYTTMRIAEKGYRVRYEPEACATEAPSASVKEELKRKVRIAAGAMQAMWRLRGMLNPLKHGMLTFQYISHRVLRWTLAPPGPGMGVCHQPAPGPDGQSLLPAAAAVAGGVFTWPPGWAGDWSSGS
jgi:hypothetical protein